MAEPQSINEPRLYRIWRQMKQRCSNPNNIAYQRYGAVGIRVCDEWLKFDPFESWARANGYEAHLTLDRERGTEGYNPSNCRWATPREQARNTSVNVNIEIDGRTQCASAWAAEAGLKVGCVLRRYHLGWVGSDLISPVNRGLKRR